jgi:hypothetical protein
MSDIIVRSDGQGELNQRSRPIFFVDYVDDEEDATN